MRLAAAAKKKGFFVRFLWPALIVCAWGWMPAVSAKAQQQQQRPLEGIQAAPTQTHTKPFISQIEFIGSRTYPRDTLLARIYSRKGDPYDADLLRRDFHALWNTAYFQNVELIVQQDPHDKLGRIVIFYLEDRPVIREINFPGLKTVTKSDVLQANKQAKVHMEEEDRFDPTNIMKEVQVIKALLAEHGRQFAVVKPTYTRIPATPAVILDFNVNEGPKVKVGKIILQGNHAFTNYRIIRTMKNTRPYEIPLYWFGIPVMSKTYDEDKLDHDLATGVEALYQDHGYERALVETPITKTVDVHRAGIPWLPLPWIGAEHGKATNITIPIEEGAVYRMGVLHIVNANPEKGLYFKTQFLESLFPVKKGQIFDAGKARDTDKTYTDLYGTLGFVDFTVQPNTDADPKTHIINLTLSFDPGKQYYVRRIDFTGNSTTRDKVIRRALMLNEGDIFNKHLWDLSILRLNQLGYFNTIKDTDATINRDTGNGTVDITLPVKEKGKQSIGLTGGVSGLAGTFIGLNYQTNNFLGLGETLTVEADTGTIQRNFTFSFQEPYLLDRPIATGFSVFSTYFAYDQARETSILLGQQVNIPGNIAENYNITSKGFSLFASAPIRQFSFARLGLTYQYSRSTITAYSAASTALFTALQFRSLAGPSQLQGIVASSFTPTLTYSTVNNFYNPTAGKYFSAGLNYEGLGGNVNLVSPNFELRYYHPINHHRNVLAFHLLTSFATGYGNQVTPPFNRFYTGGEDSVRGYDFYTISPWGFVPTLETSSVSFFNPTILNSQGQPTLQTLAVPVLHFVATRPGGDTMAVGNFEYRIPIVGNYLQMDAFFDAGLSGDLRSSQLLMNPTTLTAMRQDFPNAAFPHIRIPSIVPLAPGTNFALHDSTGIEFVVQLPIIQAPFRVYYAWNPNRLTNTIVEPTGAYFLSPALKAGLPPEVLQTQIIPQLHTFITTEPGHYPSFLFEPSHTIRFTVSRTF